MNKILYISLMVIMLALTGCREELVLADTVQPGQTSYISLVINRGGSSESRADDNLAHGDEAEYTISDALLLLFEGTSTNPDQATYVKGYQLWDMTLGTPDEVNHVSRVYIANLKLEDFQKVNGKHYYGVIIANTNDVISLNGSGLSIYNTDGKKVDWTGTYGSFKALKVDLPHDKHPYGRFAKTEGGSTSNIFMTSALLYSETGNAEASKMLPMALEVTDKITPAPLTAEQQADASNYATFYIERAMAKVQVKLTGTRTGQGNYGAENYRISYPYTRRIGSEATEVANLSVYVTGWTLVNMNVQSHIMRQWDTSWPELKSNGTGMAYRFIGASRETTGVDVYRTHFCKSAFYDFTSSDDGGLSAYIRGHIYTYHTNIGRPSEYWDAPWVADNDGYQYCYEGTMKAEQMMVKNATHVLVKAHYNINGSDGDFYTINDNRTEVFDLDHVKAAILGLINAEEGTVIEISTPTCGGTCSITSVTNKLAAEVATLNDTYTITCYKGGYGYYLIPISHFGDTYTVWNKTETPSPRPLSSSASEAENINNSYPATNRDGNYLGRWGVVRNTWYEIQITGVKGIGSPYNYQYWPDKINTDPTPLDYYNSAIECKMLIKDWTLRDQSVTLDTP